MPVAANCSWLSVTTFIHSPLLIFSGSAQPGVLLEFTSSFDRGKQIMKNAKTVFLSRFGVLLSEAVTYTNAEHTRIKV